MFSDKVLSVLEGISSTDLLEEQYDENEVLEETNSEIQILLDKNKNKNTSKSTKTWMNRLETWLKESKVRVPLFQMDSRTLDGHLCIFYSQLRKTDGTPYEPDSLRVMQGEWC